MTTRTNDELETTLRMLEEAIAKGWTIEAGIIAEHLWTLVTMEMN